MTCQGRKERKKVEDVVSKYPDMPVLFSSFLIFFLSQLCLSSAPLEEKSFKSSQVCLSWL